MDRVLKNVYYEPDRPGSFSGINPLSKYADVDRRKTVDWLQSQDTYTLHKPIRHKFKRRRTYSKGINDLIQMDLVDMQKMSRSNDGKRFILNAIDVFSRQGYAEPLMGKSAKYVAPAVAKILDSLFPPANYIQTDRGVEFLNEEVQRVFRDRNIKHYWSKNDEIKCGLVERFNRTLKAKMYKYFTHKNTERWVDVLPALLESYNKTFHRSIKMTPHEVCRENADIVRARLYPKTDYKPKWKYEVGQKCRISKAKRVFRKGFLPGWSDEIFVIKQRYSTDPVTYGLVDLMGEEIEGKFYEQEVQPITKDDDSTYIIDRVLKTRKINGKTEYLIRWRGYGEKFDSWVDNIQRL